MTLVVVIAIATSLALTPLAKQLAWRFNAVSHPDGQRKTHARPTPVWGGGSVYMALLLAVTVAYLFTWGRGPGLRLPAALALSAGMLCVLGCYDDLFDMNARWKLFWQIVSTLPIVLAGGAVDRLILLGYPFELGFAGIAFTMAWLVLGINALNLLDGMDGLASVVGIGIAVAIAAIAANHGDSAVFLLAMILVGALAGFLVYNLPPARIYLGDCGSMIIGVTLALLVLRVSLVDETSTASFSTAVALLFIPILDTTLAITRRTLQGKSPMAADRGHVHHRLLDRGFSIWQVLGILGGLCLTTGAIAWMMYVAGLELLGWAALGTLIVLLVNRQLVGHVEWRLTKQFVQQTTVRLVRRLSRTETSIRLRTIAPPIPSSQTADRETADATPPVSGVDVRTEEPKVAA